MEAKELGAASTEMELLWDPEDVSPPYVWSFSEFLDQYNELYEWLIQVQLKLYSHSNPPDKQVRMVRPQPTDKGFSKRINVLLRELDLLKVLTSSCTALVYLRINSSEQNRGGNACVSCAHPLSQCPLEI